MLASQKAVRGFGWPGVLVVGLAVLCCSCGHEEMQRKPCFPVSGTVNYKGRPAGGVLVGFYPVDKSDRAIPSSGTTEADGSFTLSTYDTDDGAPEGDYKVTIHWKSDNFRHKDAFKKKEEPDALKDRYSKVASSKIQVHVDARPNQLPPFDLN